MSRPPMIPTDGPRAHTAGGDPDVPATPGELRRFALTMGGAFAALAGAGVWRHRPLLAGVCAPLGVALVGAGLVLPARLRPVYDGWMSLARAISRVTTPIFLGVVYFAVFTPIGLIMRCVGRRPLVPPRGASSYWVARAPGARASDLRRQF
ncbi:hypothetical protein tb265_23800 [Gemmatimonadetes bacterium T265]|nr:hypothetical protein tb265_23800 [Gemmatimonadetes bacterium T265]